MGLRKTNTMFERITGATCDCCERELSKDCIGRFEDYMTIKGSISNRIKEAIICIDCIEDRFKDVKFSDKPNTIGYC
jgi:hypothetical protein